MDMHQLECLTATAEAGSYAAAAKGFGVSRQAVRKAVGGLEAELGARLIEPVGAGVHPTPAGTWLVERARPVLEAFRGLERETAEHMACASCTVAAGWSHDSSACLPLDIVVELTEEYGLLFEGFAPTRASDREIMEGLAAGRLDFGCVMADAASVAPFDAFLHRERPLCIRMAPTDPLSARAFVSAGDLRNRTLIMRARGNYVRDLIEAQCRAEGFAPLVKEGDPSLRSAAVAVLARGCLTYSFAPGRESDADGLVSVPLEGALCPHWSLRRRGMEATYARELYWRRCARARPCDAG